MADNALKAAELSVVLMDARHAHAASSMRPTKSDRSDARGLAELLRIGWYRPVTAKSFTAHERPAPACRPAPLGQHPHDLDAQIRGMLKTFGLILRPGNADVLICRVEVLVEGHPMVSSLVATCQFRVL